LLTQRGAFRVAGELSWPSNKLWIEVGGIDLCCGKYYDLENPRTSTRGVDFLIEKGFSWDGGQSGDARLVERLNSFDELAGHLPGSV